MGSGDPTTLPWPIWKLSCDWSVDTKTNMADATRVTKYLKTNNSQVRKVIHGWLSAWPAGSHRLVSWFPGSAKASPGNQETRRRDPAGPADNQPWIPLITGSLRWVGEMRHCFGKWFPKHGAFSQRIRFIGWRSRHPHTIDRSIYHLHYNPSSMVTLVLDLLNILRPPFCTPFLSSEETPQAVP